MSDKRLSARATTALAVLANGGSFRYGLERNSFTGREMFGWRLKGPNGGTIRGVGGATYRELEKNGYSFRRVASGITGIATYYSLERTDQ